MFWIDHAKEKGERGTLLGGVRDIRPDTDVHAAWDGASCVVEKARAGFAAEEEDGVHEYE